MRSSRTFRLLVLAVILQVLEVEVNAQNSPERCENDAVFDGLRCLCTGNTQGPRCEIVIDPLFMGTSHDATIRVDLTVTNYNYSDIMEDESLQEEIIDLLKKKEESLFGDFFKDVEIISFVKKEPDWPEVQHNLHISIRYSSESVILQYQKRYQEVENELRALGEKDCEQGNTLCIDGKSVFTRQIIPLSEQELCVRNIHVNFVKYFQSFTDTKNGALYCQSACAVRAENKLNCNNGTCQIGKDGPQCFCPRTDKYLYTFSRCRGAVLIAGMYGGVGAAIGVLVIVGIILGVFLYRKKYYE